MTPRNLGERTGIASSVIDIPTYELGIAYMSSDCGDGADVWAYLASLMRTLLRVSPGPFATRRIRGGWHEVSAGGRDAVARFTRPPDAALFVRAVADLRAVTAALLEVLTLHLDDGAGSCRQDGQQVPCTTRRAITDQLGPRITALQTAVQSAVQTAVEPMPAPETTPAGEAAAYGRGRYGPARPRAASS